MTTSNRDHEALKRRAVAIHEAAHSVVFYRASGEWPMPVTIEPDPARRSLGASNNTSDSFDEKAQEELVLSLYAGGHAARRLDPSCGDEGCASDEAKAEGVLSYWGWESRESEFRDRSRALVDEFWDQIMAVGDQLLIDATLTAVEVYFIVEQVAGNTEEPDLETYRRSRGDPRVASRQ